MQNIQRGDYVAISSADAVSNATRNHLFNNPIATAKIVNQNNKKDYPREVFLLQFAAEIQECLIVVGIEGAPKTRKINNLDIEKQKKVRVVKSELKKDKALEKESNKKLDAIIQFRLYDYYAFWKVNTTVVANNLRNLARNVAKREALKTIISIRVKGFGFKELHIT